MDDDSILSFADDMADVSLFSSGGMAVVFAVVALLLLAFWALHHYAH